MYAVIHTGGKQYKVQEGQTLKVESLAGVPGDKITLDKVLMIAGNGQVHSGQPYLENGRVEAEIADHGRGDKVRIIKFRRRKHSMKRMGHRQNFTAIRITGIHAS